MKTSPVQFCSYPKAQLYTCENKPTNSKSTNVNSASIPINYLKYKQSNVISFRGNNTPEIYSFLRDAKNLTPAQIRAFLDNIMNDEKKAYKFISEITKEPRDSALFEFVDGATPAYKNALERNKETPDLLALGIFCNDIAPDNYKQTINGLKAIDLGHASYFDRLPEIRETQWTYQILQDQIFLWHTVPVLKNLY